MALKDDAVIVAVGALVVIGAAWYVKSKITGAVGAVGDAVGDAYDWTAQTAGEAVDWTRQTVGEAVDWTAETAAPYVPYVNPADSSNVINQGVLWYGAQATGDPNWTLGGQIYDWLH